MRRVRPWLVALLLALAVLGVQPSTGVADQNRAGADGNRAGGQHVAGVTVSFGPGQVVRRTVSFAEGSITGLEALRRAGFAVEAYGYSGIGAAVCRIDGVGRPADSACLNGGDSYWAYWRNGTYSRIGAGASKVTDGDQEQWAWGSGTSAPPTTAFPTPTTPPPPTATTRPSPSGPSPTTATPSGGGGPNGTGPADPDGTDPDTDPDSTATTGSTGPGSSSIEPGATTSSIGDAPPTRPAAATDDDDGDEEAAGGAAAARAGDGGGGGPLALVGFAIVLGAVVALTLKARSARGSGGSRN